MGDHSAIEWTDATWNPVAGCTRVSEGCDNCYAATLVAGRLKNRPQYAGLAVTTPSGRAAFNGKIRLLPERLNQPLHWRAPRRIFVNSMSDLFHADVPFDYVDRVWGVMSRARQHTFQVLTKRPERMLEYFTAPRGLAGGHLPVLPNLWVGTSAENQEQWDARVELLGQVPAAVRFVSAEPLLGWIDSGNAFDPPPDDSDYRPIDWVIVGGESGHGARPMDLGWVHSIIEQCQAAGVAVFVKQMGAVPMMDEEIWEVEPMTKLLSARNRNRVPEGFVPLKFDDPKGGDWEEWPPEFRVREYPKRVVPA